MARLFDDASSQSAHNTALPASPPVTLSAWFNTDDDSLTQTILALYNSGATDNYWALVASGTSVGARARDGGGGFGMATRAGIVENQWHHGLATFTNTTTRGAFLDGAGGSNSDSVNPTAPGRVGVSVALSDVSVFSGMVAEVGVWNVILDAAEIAALAKGVSPLLVRPSALVMYCPLLGNDSPEIDLRGGFPLTLNNSPTKAAHPRVYRPQGLL